MITNNLVLVPVETIKTSSTVRQGRSISDEKVKELAESVAARGLIHTILVHEDSNELIAGEHRLLAFKYLQETEKPCKWDGYNSWKSIPTRFAVDVSDDEIRALELEENIKRNPIDWKDIVLSVHGYHYLKKSQDPSWSNEDTGRAVGMAFPLVSIRLRIAKELIDGNPKILLAVNMAAAYRIIERELDRAVASEMNMLGEASHEDIQKNSEISTENPDPPSIFCENFISWSKKYSGPKYNFLHCDFPFGVNHQKSGQGGVSNWSMYNDSPDIYWELCDALLKNHQNFLYPSCHILFWFSMNYYEKTVELFSPHFSVNPFPLVWHKSDNSGILPDPDRGPRRVYETALLMSRSDRKIVKAVGNLYAAPNKKELHVSEKPESVLRHFFRMLVDEHTEMLDPTCGSGSALRAAESLRAKRTVGLEKDSGMVKDATSALSNSRRLLQLNKENKS